VPGLKRRSLDSVTEFFGIPIYNRHRAGGDAVATAKVLVELLSNARRVGIVTLEELNTHLRAPRRKWKRALAMPQPVTDDTTA
jgi:DNA polymerase III epsilon subunit-like protein